MVGSLINMLWFEIQCMFPCTLPLRGSPIFVSNIRKLWKLVAKTLETAAKKG